MKLREPIRLFPSVGAELHTSLFNYILIKGEFQHDQYYTEFKYTYINARL